MAEDRLKRMKCPLYFETGVCRYENPCPYHHNRPTISPTLLLSNMYQRPDMITPGIDAQGNPIDPDQIQEHFENFYEDIFKMLSKYGEIMWLFVCDNLANHMTGNVYVKFRHERRAQAAFRDLQGMLYNSRPIKVEYSPVTKFYDSTCLPFKQNSCKMGSDCDLLHVKKIRHELNRKLFRDPSYRRDRESRERSHERGDHRDRDRKRHERRYERRSGTSRYSRSRSRSRSPSYRRDRESRERSHERGDRRDRDRVRHERRYDRMSRRSSYSKSRSRSRSPRMDRESRERLHERGDRRDRVRDRVRHERRYERRSRYSRSWSSRSPSYRRDGRHMKEVIIGGAVSRTEIGKGMKGGQGAKDGLEARLGPAVRNRGLRLSSVIVREEKEQNDE